MHGCAFGIYEFAIARIFKQKASIYESLAAMTPRFVRLDQIYWVYLHPLPAGLGHILNPHDSVKGNIQCRDVVGGSRDLPYLNGPEDPWSTQLAARQSVIHSFDRRACNESAPQSVRTSLLPQGSDFTDDGSLACLAEGPSAATSKSAFSSEGQIPSVQGMRLLTTDNGGALVPTSLPVFRDREQGLSRLECPFNFLYCIINYAIQDLDEWIEHSLSHFRVEGLHPRTAFPPTSNQCCFCEMEFENSNGLQSWRERMKHVAWHHRAGHSLSHARPDFKLFRYLWEERILSSVEYRELGNLMSTSRTEEESKYVPKPLLGFHADSSNSEPTSEDKLHSLRPGIVDSLTYTPRKPTNDHMSMIQRSNVREPDPLPLFDNVSSEDKCEQSECSDEDANSLLPSDPSVVMNKAKHDVLANLMVDVYAMFGSRVDAANIRTCATSSESGPSGTLSQSSSSKVPTFAENGKRRMRGRRSSRGDDDDNGKRRKKIGSNPDQHHQSRRYACPFHKYDPGRYSVKTSVTVMYRTCSGPGYTAISRLKQHLRKFHRTLVAPEQCRRCWAVLPNEKALTAHANDDIRCEKQEPPPEDINQAKLDLIDSSWGASWEEIYDILFPGAPIPSPYYEEDEKDSEMIALDLSGSSGFEGFDAYARRELPQMLEARLWAEMSSNRAPIAEALKALLAEILPSCQSMVAENFRSIRGARTGKLEMAQGSSSSSIHPVLSGADVLLGDWELAPLTTTQRPTDSTPQSPHVDIGELAPNEQSKHGTGSQRHGQGEFTYSACRDSMLPYICACHHNYHVDQPSNGVPVGKDCGYCGVDHVDYPNFSFDQLFDLPDI